jgi:endonuclease III
MARSGGLRKSAEPIYGNFSNNPHGAGESTLPPRQNHKHDGSVELAKHTVGRRVTRSQTAKFGLAPTTNSVGSDSTKSPRSKDQKGTKLEEDAKTVRSVMEDVKPTSQKALPSHSPYPDWPKPSSQECEEVHRLLTKVHGDASPPEATPVPSLNVSGCGEVPSVLDALLRTILSGATTMSNADKALQGLIKHFGILQQGIGKGSVDWDKVRLASQEDVYNAVKTGGLGLVKSRALKSVLDMVYMQNLKLGVPPDSLLSLEQLRDLTTTDAAMEALVRYPGVGVKTAACVILFCLQIPCFAVDTHVHRICRWLKWVPENANETKTFQHCDAKIPAHLKYGLHQLFIRHGKTCIRCKGGSVHGSKEYNKSVCCLESLVDRFTKRQAKTSGKSDVSVKRPRLDQEEDKEKRKKKMKKKNTVTL